MIFCTVTTLNRIHMDIVMANSKRHHPHAITAVCVTVLFKRLTRSWIKPHFIDPVYHAPSGSRPASPIRVSRLGILTVPPLAIMSPHPLLRARGDQTLWEKYLFL
jgi:hypothetical protein